MAASESNGRKGGCRCIVCGEWIPRPVPQSREVCVECEGDHPWQPGVNRDKGASTDRDYHGGEFNKGEW